MALFRRKQKDSVLPEVDKYYQAERRDRTGLAWLLALISIAIVAGVIVALFLVGRWAYNEIVRDDEPSNIATNDTAQTPNTEEPAGNDNQTPSGDQEVPADQPSQPAPAPNPTATTPTTGDDTALPRTGAGSVVAVFAGVSTLAGGVHYAINRKRQS